MIFTSAFVLCAGLAALGGVLSSVRPLAIDWITMIPSTAE